MANLKAGTLIGGNLIWDAGNLPLRTTDNNLYIRNAQVYTTEFNPTPSAVGAVAKTGDTMSGALTINNALTVGSPSNRYTTSLNGTLQVRTDNYGCRVTAAGDRGYFQAGNAVDPKQPHHMSITGWSAEPLTNLEIKMKAGSIWFNSDGTITANVAPASGNHLVNKAYADTKVALGGSTMTGKLTLDYTSSVKVPVGNSSQRGNSVRGDFRFNTDETSFEGHDGNEWQPIGSGRVSYTMYTSNFTAVRGKGHLVDTRNAGMVVTLPTNVRNSDFVVIGDGSKNASKNPFWVAGFNGDRLLVDRDNCILRFGYFGNKWIIEDGVGENGAINTGEFVARTGSAMSGKLTIEGRNSAGSFGVKRTGSSQFANFGQSGDSGGEALVGVGPTAEDYVAYLKVGKDKLVFQGGSGEKKVYHEGEKPFKVHRVEKPSGLVDGKYYPVVIRGAVNNQQVYIHTRQSGGADPMNNCSFDGIVRAMGWSDGISFAQGVFTIYQENERAIHSIMANSESEGVYAFYVEARAFPLVVRVDSSCSVNAYNADRTEGTTTYKAGVTATQIDDGSSVVKARRLMNFDNGTGFYRADGIRNSDTAKLQGAVNFDDYTTGRTYNLYGTQSGTNSPPFSYGTMIVIGRGNGSNTFVTQIATERGNRTTYIRTRNDNGVWTTWVKSYDEANKPTPAEIGAVSLTADNGMTGILRIKNTAHNTIPATDECKYDGYGVIGNRGTVYLTNANTGSSAQVQIGVGGKHADAAKFIVYSNKVDTTVDLLERGKRVYSENNKPSAATIGAVNKAGDTMTGVLTVDANAAGVRITRNEYPGINLESRNLTSARTKLIEVNNGGHLNFITRDANGSNNGVITLEAGKSGSIYHTGFKPSAADVGAFTNNAGGITNQDWNTLTTAGSYAINNFTGANKPEIVGHPPVYTYGTLLVQNNGHTISQMYITDANKIYLRDKYSSNSWGVWTAVANDESAVIDKSVNLDDYSYGGTFNMYKGSGVTFTNAPSDFSYGTLQVIGRGRTTSSFVTQILTWKDNGRQMIRTRNDGSFAWTSWQKIYSSVQKPTAEEVGAWPASRVNQAGNNWADVVNKVPMISSVGVMEVGSYIDMKCQDTSVDFNWRLHANDPSAFIVRNGAGAEALTVRGTGEIVTPAGGFSAGGHTCGFFAFNKVYGGEAASIIRGSSEEYAWVNWRTSPCGLLIDAPNAHLGAHSIFKATRWGAHHLAAMDVHYPSADINQVQLSMHLGGSNNQFAFKANGQGFASAGWHTGSDSRFKEDIRPLSVVRTGWLDKVCSLNASSFKYKTSDKTSIGFIAQDVQKHIPEAISVQIDTTLPEDQREGTDRLFIDPVAIIAAQNEAIKELRARLEALENK